MADDSPKNSGPKKPDNSRETSKQAEKIDSTNTNKTLALKKSSLPSDVYNRAKSILETGGITEKQLVKRMLDGSISPQRFRLLLKLLYYPEGSDKEKKLRKGLAEDVITGRISKEIFELAVSAVNRGNPVDLELVKKLHDEKVGPELFKKKLKGKRELGKETIETQEKTKEISKDQENPDETTARFGSKFGFLERMKHKAEGRVTPPNQVGETIEFRTYFAELQTLRRKSVEEHDGLRSVCSGMANGDKILKEKIYDTVYGLFPTVIRKGDKDITREQMRSSLEKFARVERKPLKIGENIDKIYNKFQAHLDLRKKEVEIEVKIAEILRKRNNQIDLEARENAVMQNAGNCSGIPIKVGRKVRYNTKSRDTGGLIVDVEEAEILDVRFSTPVRFDVESGEDVPTNGTGSVLITVSGVGEMTESQFKKWVDAADVCPIINTVKEVEEITGFHEFGIPLKKGTSLAYEKVVGRDKKRNVIYEQRVVTIKSISDTEVELDREVEILRRDEAPRLAINGDLPEDRISSKMTLGQFAKWIGRRDVVPNPANLEDLREASRNLKEARDRKYSGTRNPDHFKEIRWKQDEVVFEDTDYNGEYFVVDVNEKTNQVALDGEVLTLANALRVARNRELESLDVDTEAKRQTVFMGNTQLAAPAQAKVRAEVERKIERVRLKKNEVNRTHAMETARKQILEDMGSEGPQTSALARQRMEEMASGMGVTGEISDEAAGEGIDELPKHIPSSRKITDWSEYVPAARSGSGILDKAARPSRSYLAALWKTTSFLSIQDLWELGKSCYEYWTRRWQRNIKNTFGNVGKHLPLFGTEMARVQQEAETGEVNQFKEAMNNWGQWQIEDTLYGTKNRDQTKACLIVLSSKGYMRWEDIRLWKTLNRFVSSNYFIPIPANGDFTAQDKYGRTGIDYLAPAIDSLWGEGSHSEWFNQNNNTFEQNKKSFHHMGDGLEGDPKNIGGVTAELGNLLAQHKRGEYVDPQKYEGLIDFCIHKGKSSAEAKLYYLMEGVAAKNSRGQTILPFDRVGNIDGEYLNRLPLLDYFTEKVSQKPFQDKVRPWKRADLEKICALWDGGVGRIGTADDGTPPMSAINFLWEEVLRNPWVLARNNKGLRNADQIDHDDAHVIVPLANEDLVQNICGSHVGTKKFFTDEAVTNAYPGYNRYIKTLLKHNDVPKLLQTIRSFARFDAIVSNRYLKEQGDKYVRVPKSNYYRRSIACTLFTQDHQKQLHKMLKKVSAAYGIDTSIMFETTHHEKTDPAQKQKQREIEDFISHFGQELEKRVVADGGEKMLEVLGQTELTGIDYDMGKAEVVRRNNLYAEDAKVYGLFAGKLQ